jgi:BirA family biotin operon repressor/biotin-[acetyl-CoA-carboxylase] ligase
MSDAGRSCTELAGPGGTRFGTVRRFTELDSTNRYLLDQARAGAPEGMAAVADYQSAGRGRLARRWEAPPGSNLLTSVLLRPVLPVEDLHLCTVAVALAAADACERGAAVTPELKWPNDLMVRGRKLGGILAEALPAAPAAPGAPGGSPAAPAVVVGLGLNVRWPPPDTVTDPDTDTGVGHGPDRVGAPFTDGPDEVLAGATSLWRETGVEHDPLALLQLLLTGLEGRLVDLGHRDGRRRLAGEYRRRCDTVGKTVRVSLAEEAFTGTATDITVEGHLLVDVGPCLRTVAAGDVVHLRDPS